MMSPRGGHSSSGRKDRRGEMSRADGAGVHGGGIGVEIVTETGTGTGTGIDIGMMIGSDIGRGGTSIPRGTGLGGNAD